jgi:guanylate kinase
MTKNKRFKEIKEIPLQYKILALFGKSCAGKDTIQKWLIKNTNMNGIISCTTRPKRDYEKDGVDYYFLNGSEFFNNHKNNKLIEITEFNNWYYGTLISSLDTNKINIGVFNPKGIRTLLKDNRLKVQPVYIDCSDKIRLLRAFSREKNPDYKEICRRFLTDEKDFSNIDFNYIVFDNKTDKDDYSSFLNILPKEFNQN